MGLVNGDVAAAHNFAIQIDGVQVEYLAEVGPLVMEQDTFRYTQNNPNGHPTPKAMPGISQGGTVTVTRGHTQSSSFTDWINQSMAGNMASARKNATIIYMDYMNNPIKRYDLRDAWCFKVETSGAKAGEASVLTEQISIIFDDMVIA